MKNRFLLLMGTVLCSHMLQAQFTSPATNWLTPQGGNITNNNLLGYNNTGGTAMPGQSNNSETWNLVDMNGDSRPDLVVTGTWANDNNTQFNATNNPYWKVYLSNGSGFATTAANWPTPQGGRIINNTLLGYNDVSGVAISGQSNNSETWTLTDINGDSKPDLVVMGARTNSENTQFSATSNPYWKVYVNSGTGFAASATTWSTPQGGNITSNALLGYNDVSGIATITQSNNSESWTLTDITGDAKPDLVVTGNFNASNNRQFSATSNPYWKVYVNSGTGFAASATTWSTPQGGNITSNSLLGYNRIDGVAYAGQSNNSETWTLLDMNGDAKSDLVVTGAFNGTDNVQFNATTTANWKVFLNNGSGFATSATTWSTPQGGNITNNALLGYNNLSGYANSSQSNNSETWSVVDLNGDKKPDLAITGSLTNSSNAQFNATANPYWKLFLNTGTGFAGSATNWSTPQGGNITNNSLLGYNSTYGVAVVSLSNSSETWSVVDLNGDGAPDLVVTGALSSGSNTQFNSVSSPNWKVFFNGTVISSVTDVAASQFVLYPNPAKDLFNLQFDKAANRQISIANVQGSRIKSLQTNDALIAIDMSNQPAGIYFVAITENGQTIQTRLVVGN